MFCEKCGAKIEEGKEYCPSCGSKIDVNTAGSDAGAAMSAAGSSTGGASRNYQIPDRVVEKPLDKLKRNNKRVVHFIGCIILVLAMFRPFIAYSVSKVVDNAEKYGYSDSQIEKLKDKAHEASKEFTAVNICDKENVFILVIIFFIFLVVGIFMSLMSKYVPAFIFEVVGSVPIVGYLIIEILDHNVLKMGNMHFSTGFFMVLIAWIVLIASCVIQNYTPSKPMEIPSWANPDK